MKTFQKSDTPVGVQYRVIINDVIKAEVYFKPFFIELANSHNKKEFEKCYEADLRTLRDKFKLVLSDKDWDKYESMITTF